MSINSDDVNRLKLSETKRFVSKWTSKVDAKMPQSIQDSSYAVPYYYFLAKRLIYWRWSYGSKTICMLLNQQEFDNEVFRWEDS